MNIKALFNSTLSPTACIAVLLASIFATSASAQTNRTWNGTTNTTWNTAGNWTGGVPDTITEVALFSTATANDPASFGTAITIGGFSLTGGEARALTFTNTIALDQYGVDNSSTFNLSIAGAGLTTLSAAQTWSITNTGNTTFSKNVANGGFLLTLDATSTGVGLIDSIMSGTGGITKTGSGTWTLSGVNTRTGVTTINAGVLSVGTIGNGGVAGNLGQATNAAANLVLGGGTLQYTGATASTDRNFTLTAATTSTIDVTTNNLTISGASTATSGGLTKIGAGTLTLTGNNLYTGATAVTEGTLSLARSGGTLAASAVTVNGGTLDMAQSDTVGAVTLSSGTISGSGTLTGTSYSLTDTGTASAILAGAVTLTKTGAGTATLSGVNTYTGATTINAGVLSVGTIGNGGVAGNLGQATNAAANLVLGGGTLQYTGATASTNRNFTLTALTTSTIEVTANNLTISGASTNTTGALTKTGAGTLTLSGTNLHTGLTTVSAGTLAYGASNVISTGAVTVDGATAVLDLGANRTDSVGIVTVAGGGSITGTGTSALTTTGTFEMQDGSVSAILAGAVPLNKTTAGTMVLSGANTYTGLTTVSAGVLQLGSTAALGTTAGNTTLTGTGTLDLNGQTVTGETLDAIAATAFFINDNVTTAATWTGGITSMASGGSIGGNGNLTLSGVVASGGGNAAITKVGTGTLFLTNNGNTFTRAVNINAGVVNISANNALGVGGTAANVVAAGAALEMQGNITTSATAGNIDLTLNGTGVSNGGALRNVSGSNTFSHAIVLGSTGVRINSDSGLLTLPGGITGGGFNLTVGGAGNVTFGTAAIATTTGTLTKDGAGTLTMNFANTYTGLTTVSAGTLAYGVSNALSTGAVTVDGATSVLSLGAFSDSVGVVTLSNGGTISGSGTLTSTSPFALQNGSVTGILGGAVALNKTTSGTVTLSGINAYTGATTVTAGKLTVSAGNINSTSGVSVGAAEFNYNSSTALSKAVTFSTTGGKLSGNGTITPATTISSGNTLAPGNSIGTLSFGTGLTISGTYDAELGTPGATPAAGLSDRAVVTGGLTLTGGTLNLIDNAGANAQGSVGPGAYRLATYTTTLTGTFATVNNPLSSTLHEKVVYGPASGGGAVDLNVYRLATVNSITTPVTLTNVHVGDSFTSSALSIQNTASNDGFSEGLNASGGSITGDATTSGSQSNLAGGSTGTSVLVGLTNTGTAGAKSGTVNINLASNGTNSGYSNTALTAQTITVNGGVYNLAAANSIGTPIDLGTVHAGGTFGTSALSISNTAASGAFTEGLDASFSGTTGLATNNAGSFTNLAGAGNNNSSLIVGLGGNANTGTAGVKTGTATIALVSNGTISGLANTALTSQTVTVNGFVYSGIGVWNVNSNGNWNSTGNWQTNGGVPGLDAGFTDTDTATFGAAATSTDVTVSLNGVSPSLNGVVFNNATQSYTVAQGSSGTLKLNNGASAATLASFTGTHTISAPVQLQSNVDATVGIGSRLSVNDVISESGGSKSLTLTSGGTLALGGANTYSGGTTVSGGTLEINNISGSATGSGSVIIDAGATLSGGGQLEAGLNNSIVINGSLQVGYTGDLSAVDINLVTSGTGEVTLGSTSIIYMDLWSNDGGLTSTESDSVRLFGSLTFNAGSTLTLLNPNSLATFASGDSWQVFDLSGGGVITGNPFLDTSAFNFGSLLGVLDITTGVFSLNSVPEPSRALLMLIGLVTVTMRRRRSVRA